MNKSNVLLINQVGIYDIGLAGEKNAFLGEMLQHATKQGINIPPGFVITVNAYNYFIRYNALDEVISRISSEINFTNPESFQKAGQKIRKGPPKFIQKKALIK